MAKGEKERNGRFISPIAFLYVLKSKWEFCFTAYWSSSFLLHVSEYEQHIVRLLRFGRMATFCCIFFFGDAFQVFIFRKFVVAMSHLETAEVECCRIKFWFFKNIYSKIETKYYLKRHPNFIKKDVTFSTFLFLLC